MKNNCSCGGNIKTNSSTQQNIYSCSNSCGNNCNSGNKKSSKCSSIPPPDKGAKCRACGDFNDYAEPDKIINDHKYTCYSCRTHPERHRKGLPSDKVQDMIDYYNKQKFSYSKK